MIAHLNAENDYTTAMTKSLEPFQEQLYKEMKGHLQETDEVADLPCVPARRVRHASSKRPTNWPLFPQGPFRSRLPLNKIVAQCWCRSHRQPHSFCGPIVLKCT